MIVSELCKAFLKAHPIDSARGLESLGPAAAAELLAELDVETAARAIGTMHPEFAATLLLKMPAEAQFGIVNRLEIHQVASMLRRLGAEDRERLLSKASGDVRGPLKRLLRYPENTVGARMDPHYPCLTEDQTLEQALEKVRVSKDRGAFFLFVIDRTQTLTGIVSVLELLGPDSAARVGDVKRRCGRRLSASTDLEAIRRHRELIQWNALPVVDEKGLFLGAVRQQTVAKVERIETPGADAVSGASGALAELYQLGLLGLAGSLEPPPSPERNANSPNL